MMIVDCYDGDLGTVVESCVEKDSIVVRLQGIVCFLSSINLFGNTTVGVYGTCSNPHFSLH